MNRLRYIVLVFVISFISLSEAQEEIKHYNKKNSIKTWYAYNASGELGSCTIFEDKIIFKSPLDSNNEKSISTVFIEKRLDDRHMIVRNDDKKPPYAIIQVIKTGKSILKMAPIVKGISINSVEKSFKENKTPNWINLTEKDWYTEKQIEQLKKAPGLDKLTRDDLLLSMQWRKPLSEKIQQYLKDTKGERQFMVYRFVNEYRNKKLVELGYNPYKFVEYNLEKQFEGDEEVLKLLFEEIKF
ncbi:hypothetical protein [uncultured Aquimarina sp.]|uniref:hypothetical protein n=1 Tax=uncultured Aquimarina sp. TaxID=575652 RepID=UPI0026023DBB|nr:hypothetical protein [uncultured Aquimarina sp.]